MITRLSIAFEDFPGSSIASQVMPPCAEYTARTLGVLILAAKKMTSARPKKNGIGENTSSWHSSTHSGMKSSSSTMMRILHANSTAITKEKNGGVAKLTAAARTSGALILATKERMTNVRPMKNGLGEKSSSRRTSTHSGMRPFSSTMHMIRISIANSGVTDSSTESEKLLVKTTFQQSTHKLFKVMKMFREGVKKSYN